MGTVGVLAALAAIVLVVSAVSRHQSLPCPSWLVPLLENPYMNRVAGAMLLLGRAGVAPSMHVLDAGCGPGRLTIPAARTVGPTGRVTALDLQPRMLEKLRARLEAEGVENVDTVQAGLGAAGLPSATFDVALLVTVLGEIPDKLAALREIRQSLKPGGILSITEVMPDPHYQSLARVRDLAHDAGLNPVQVFGTRLAFTVNLRK